MKKGQGQLIGFVLLIGFTVVIGIMVGNWMIQRSRSVEGIIEQGDTDAMCPDVQIDPICEGGQIKIRNNGNFNVRLKINGGELTDKISLKKTSQSLNIGDTVIPFIEIRGKDYGCSSQSRTINESPCINE